MGNPPNKLQLTLAQTWHSITTYHILATPFVFWVLRGTRLELDPVCGFGTTKTYIYFELALGLGTFSSAVS